MSKDGVAAEVGRRVRRWLGNEGAAAELAELRVRLEHMSNRLASLRALLDTPRLCTVLLLAEDQHGRGWYAAQSFTLPRNHDRLVQFHPQVLLAPGAWLVGLGGVLLHGVRVGLNAQDVAPGDSPVARLSDAVQIAQTIACRAMLHPAYPPEDFTLQRART